MRSAFLPTALMPNRRQRLVSCLRLRQWSASGDRSMLVAAVMMSAGVGAGCSCEAPPLLPSEGDDSNGSGYEWIGSRSRKAK